MILLPHQASSGAVSKKRDGDEVDLIEDTPMKELERLNISTFTSWKKKIPSTGSSPNATPNVSLGERKKNLPASDGDFVLDTIASSTTVYAPARQLSRSKSKSSVIPLSLATAEKAKKEEPDVKVSLKNQFRLSINPRVRFNAQNPYVPRQRKLREEMEDEGEINRAQSFPGRPHRVGLDLRPRHSRSAEDIATVAGLLGDDNGEDEKV
uniref:Uncharacterized protein n=1 Tax=Palpitomonas bilix TaxID=652834 RepID=A0A7S3LWT7_9EUKA|mmetsp:Transcript_6866/g.17289  ORF Transcript_6866/g.17289 Transcript_6866/m.17289 type:complete len:209 (+) Transcript_6866:363-989(+)|eukprot:CAMPEP_0113886790 /NCGR_PEP_ID=MMETSP0780_2-20120614/11778_1 /TAXON_ID=652834 /ORGANISM="Palpitomonas bilix" /LENGTH=208 /DNA_ID=CAMNT_0000875099 /DNA_START=325 /DNA_END=951 /DNA_ORIENTATION=- /assembly_acc=CAM_ASM_000599